jgi:hypothetical protein
VANGTGLPVNLVKELGNERSRLNSVTARAASLNKLNRLENIDDTGAVMRPGELAG